MKNSDANLIDRKCLVCGDRAVGYNFNGYTCESCKIFFRRNAHRLDKSKCLKGGCEIDFVTRKSCQKCRIDKCFKIGMKKELIKYKYTKYSKPKKDVENCSKIINLQPHDQKLIQDIERAISIFVDEESVELSSYEPDIVETINYASFYIEKVIKFCKQFHTFRGITPEDQLVILKPFFSEMIWIYTGFNFCIEKDGYLCMMNEKDEKACLIRMEIFRQYKQKDVIVLFRLFYRSLHSELENDPTIRNLVIAYLLFKSRDGVTCLELMRYHNSVYGYLLKRYLQCKYQSEDKAEKKYISLIKLLDELPNINDVCKQIFFYINSNKFTQIWNELLT